MKVKSKSFKVMSDGKIVVKEEKEIEVKNDSQKGKNKRPRKSSKTLPESEQPED